MVLVLFLIVLYLMMEIVGGAVLIEINEIILFSSSFCLSNEI